MESAPLTMRKILGRAHASVVPALVLVVSLITRRSRAYRPGRCLTWSATVSVAGMGKRGRWRTSQDRPEPGGMTDVLSL